MPHNNQHPHNLIGSTTFQIISHQEVCVGWHKTNLKSS